MGLHRVVEVVEEDPAVLEAEAHEDIARGHEKLARATRLRRTTRQPNADAWVTLAQFEAETGLKGRRLVDGGKRGELQLHKLGDAVVVRRSELDRWILAHPVAAKVVAEPGESDEDVYAKLAAGSK